MLRVWLPPGFSEHLGGDNGHPVLYLNDGQNLFYDSMSFSGCSWRAAQAAAGLIGDGTLPPYVIVGIDHSGATRSLDYCPVKPGTGPGNFRCVLCSDFAPIYVFWDTVLPINTQTLSNVQSRLEPRYDIRCLIRK